MPRGAPLTRVGIVGCGAFGLLHARCWMRVEGTALTAFQDVASERARVLAAEFGGEALRDVSDLRDRVDAVSVAVPPQAQMRVAMACLEAGADVLLEKPFCADAREARALGASARERGLVLQAGYVERHLPAFELVAREMPRPAALSARRIQAKRPKTFEEGPVLDLMVHDIEHALSLARAPTASVSARREPGAAPGEEMVRATLAFDCGFVADLLAGYSEHRALRELELDDGRGHRLRLDLRARTLETRHGTRTLSDDNALLHQLRAFKRSVEDAEPVTVCAVDAVRVLEIAHEIISLVRSQRGDDESDVGRG